MSDFQAFLASQQAEGVYHSEGCFTVDFADAAQRLAVRLPSENHFLLKMVQLASRLGAESVEIKLERFRSAVHFRAPRASGVNDTAAIARAFLAPLQVADRALSDLVAALWGSLGETTLETVWSFSQGYQGRRLFLRGQKLRAEDFQIQVPLDDQEMPCAFTLSVIRRKSWRFWIDGRRNAQAARLLSEQCALSRMAIRLDGRRLETAGGSFLTSHRKVRTVYGETPQARAYQVVVYQLAPPGQGFQLARPSLAQYMVRERHFNVWTSATRVYNELKPDGISTPSWLLQFIEGRKNLGIREVDKLVRCALVLAYDPRAAKDKEELRLTLVRHCVLLQPVATGPWAEELQAWNGCHLLLEDDSLETDLTGFQVLENERLLQLLRSLTPRLEATRAFLEQGRPLLRGLKAR
jgi:hypothetical protein